MQTYVLNKNISMKHTASMSHTTHRLCDGCIFLVVIDIITVLCWFDYKYCHTML